MSYMDRPEGADRGNPFETQLVAGASVQLDSIGVHVHHGVGSGST